MKSHIDWNEVVAKLPPGLQQTLYLEAVKLITSPAQIKRDYQAEYYRRKKNGSLAKSGITRRQFTDEFKKEAVEYLAKHGNKATAEKFDVGTSVISRWGQDAKKG